jgi:hypothetical protein
MPERLADTVDAAVTPPFFAESFFRASRTCSMSESVQFSEYGIGFLGGGIPGDVAGGRDVGASDDAMESGTGADAGMP